jgi:hypothetical protein
MMIGFWPKAVGAGLLANAVEDPIKVSRVGSIRQQAGSYRSRFSFASEIKKTNR